METLSTLDITIEVKSINTVETIFYKPNIFYSIIQQINL